VHLQAVRGLPPVASAHRQLLHSAFGKLPLQSLPLLGKIKKNIDIDNE
jgi:predicted ATPase